MFKNRGFFRWCYIYPSIKYWNRTTNLISRLGSNFKLRVKSVKQQKTSVPNVGVSICR